MPISLPITCDPRSGADVLVGLCVERALDMVVGLLGILKAGGAYVPLDPSSPVERLAFMLEDAGASLLVTLNTIAMRLSVSNVNLICLDTNMSAIAQRSAANPPAKLHRRSCLRHLYLWLNRATQGRTDHTL